MREMHYLLYSYSYVIVKFLVLINSIVLLNTLDIHISFLFESINVNIGITVPYSHLLYLINGSIISGAKRCLQINDRQLYLCRWRTTSMNEIPFGFSSCCCCQVYDTGTAGSKLFAKCFTMGH